MELTEGIETRRSIRRYTTEPVSDDMVRRMLELAMYAPSAQNQQPWHFIVVSDRAVMLRIMEHHPFATMLREAARAIIVCGDIRQAKRPDYWPVDCSAATQNLLLAAHGLGLGAVWMGVYPMTERMDALTMLFKLPEGVYPFAVVAVGHPAEKPPQPKRFREERVHYGRW